MDESAETLTPATNLDPKLLQLCSSLNLGTRIAPADEPSNSTKNLATLFGKLGPKCIVDCLGGTKGSGAGLLGLFLCMQFAGSSGELVVIDGEGSFFPPTAIAWGIDAKKLLVIRPKSHRDAIAAAEIALRSPAVSAVWASLDQIDPKCSRRLLLATESAEAFGVLVRSIDYLKDPCWADVQMRCDPIPHTDDQSGLRVISVTQTRNRHGPLSARVLVSMDPRTGNIEAGFECDEFKKAFTPHPVSLATGLAGTEISPRAS